MAATIVCRVCFDVLIPIKRRSVFSKSFNVFSQLTEVLEYIPIANDGMSLYICLACYSKLNKINKIDYDLQHRMESLRSEKTAIISFLRSKMAFPTTHIRGKPHTAAVKATPPRLVATATPEKESEKRKFVLRTPTPRKSKRALLSTPRKHARNISNISFGENIVESVDVGMESLAEVLPEDTTETLGNKFECQKTSRVFASGSGDEERPNKRIRKSVLKGLFSPGHMKVQHRVKAGEVRTRVIKNVDSKSIVSSICRGDTAGCIAKKILRSDLKWSVRDQLLKMLFIECQKLCSTNNPTLLRKICPDNLRAIKFDLINVELEREAPLFFKTINCLTGGSKSSTIVAASICLFARNHHLSLMQHIIGQVLDHSGATDEAIQTLNKLGISVSTTSVNRQRKLLQQDHEKHVQEMFSSKKRDDDGATEIGTSHIVEVIGDNIDITRTPSQMSKERKRKSWHWFLLVGVKKQVLFPNLPDNCPIADIMQIDNATFVPSQSDCEKLEENFIHHIMHILVKHVLCLQNMTPCLPDHINHPYEKDTSRKTDYTVLDLLDKSENKSDEMITILEHVHENYIPHRGDPPSVLEKKVFGGDCLTNERAYAAQLALLNSPTDHTRLAGIIHRPEGLHRMMNICLFIYQQFYKTSSARDAGTLYQLRNVLKRVNVHGPNEVVGSYRAHYSFIQDCLDGYVVGACMELLGLEQPDGEPEVDLPSLNNNQMKYRFLHKIAMDIMEKFVKLSDSVHNIQDDTATFEAEAKLNKERFDATQQKYVCECGMKYKTIGFYERHLKNVHQIEQARPKASELSKNDDHMALMRASFMKCTLLLRDTNDAYKRGDGTRIARNAKFEMLLCDVGKHSKYKLWLFIFQAYISALLTERQAMEYKWNCTSNTQGGEGKNIPNDNLVEMTVQAVKKKIHQQGANATYQSARSAALSMTVQTEIKKNLMQECKSKQSGKSRPEVTKTSDIKSIVTELRKSEIFKYTPGRSFEGFPNFKDVFSRVKTDQLYGWISKQKKRLSNEML